MAKKDETKIEETKVEEVKEETKVEESAISDDIEVDDPLELRPKELPLVVKPKKGKKWKNDAQEEYAKTLNGYAYKNPTKWESKKNALLKNLTDLEKNPTLIEKLRGVNEGVQIKNQLIQTTDDK